jgi:hypothetical protein
MALIILLQTIIPLIFHTFQNAEYRNTHSYNFAVDLYGYETFLFYFEEGYELQVSENKVLTKEIELKEEENN